MLRRITVLALAASVSFTVPAFAEGNFWARGTDRTQTASTERNEPRKLTKAERQKAERQKAEQAKKQQGKKLTREERRKLEQAQKKQAKTLTREERQQLQQAEARKRMLEASRERDRARTADQQQVRTERPLPGLLSAFFGGTRAAEPQFSRETRAQDQVLQERQRGKKQYQVPSEFEPQTVAYSGGYKRGTIVIDTKSRYLYLVEGFGSARRYKVAVGREGLLFTGKATIGDMQEWPRWIPTKDMQKREPKKYGQYKDGMDGGPDNPLGARAIYLYQGNRDTYIRIHGTNQPQTVGTNSSNGCFRMVNEHVMDLYNRVSKGSEVVVL